MTRNKLTTIASTLRYPRIFSRIMFTVRSKSLSVSNKFDTVLQAYNTVEWFRFPNFIPIVDKLA